MKKILGFLLMVAVLATAAQATDISSSFVNIDFDSGDVTTGGPGFKGFDAPDATEIIGWTNYPAGATLNDAGVEATTAWWAPYETNSAFMSSGDGAYNISSYVIQDGDAFFIGFMAKTWWENVEGEWTVTLFYDDPANVIGTFVQGDFTTTWTAYSNPNVIVATPASVGGTLGILFESTGASFANLDEVTVATVRLENSSPANGATSISVIRTDSANDLVFTIYDPVLGANDVEVYLSAGDPNAADLIKTITSPGTGTQTVTLETELSADLSFDTTYYWKVIAHEPNALASGGFDPVSGPVWSFITPPPTPLFSTQPGFSAVFPGESAVLTATVTSTTALTGAIQWYTEAGVEVTTADSNVSISEVTVGAQTTSTLTIANATVAYEGLYYAKATNSGGSINSTNGKVVIKRLLAYYPFEGNANDASGNGLDGTESTLGTTLPTYSAGKVGQAVNLSNTYSNYIDLPDDFSDFRSGVTFNLWAYPTAVGNWANFIQFSNVSETTPSENLFFCRSGTSTTLQFRTAIGTTQGNSINGLVAIEVNKWQMFTVTMDSSGLTKLYKNGVRYFYYNNDGTINTPEVTVSMPTVVTRVNNYIGKSAWSDSYFTGQMDEVRVYNYALTDTEVADQYIEDAGLISVCQSMPDYDLDGDCKVTLTDFAEFATQWLDCGLYPADSCN